MAYSSLRIHFSRKRWRLPLVAVLAALAMSLALAGPAAAARIEAGGGLAGLAERVRTVDGRLLVTSPAGGPTVVTVELPSHA